MRITVICPSRERPDKALEAFQSFVATVSSPAVSMIFVVDRDDPKRLGYVANGLPMVDFLDYEKGGMGPPLNAAAQALQGSSDILGFIGDDHRFRTPDWDKQVTEALKDGGICYGDDLGRPDLPTQVFMSSKIVRALGWMCLPNAKHLYLDDTWKTLGEKAGCLYFLPNVIIEHMHPVYGKAERDAGYARVNASAVYSHDGQLYTKWIESGQADLDAAVVKEALANLSRP